MELIDFDFRIWDKDKKCFLNSDTKNKVITKNLSKDELKKFELEIYIGIKDKYGNKIFDGDILLYKKNKKKYIFEIINGLSHCKEFLFLKCEFDEVSQTIVKAPYYQAELSNKLNCHCSFHYKVNEVYFEVIGNIHENEDLIYEKLYKKIKKKK
ncbi:hypothetical protein H2274_07135 [Campylobacter sp. W0049]|uniref:YopX family protein n=1 Tax=Campylobacter molothri TaxID=1032242 RepID=UPI00301D42E9|nr:hypothetical protein [Campylobacter sp. W0049]